MIFSKKMFIWSVLSILIGSIIEYKNHLDYYFILCLSNFFISIGWVGFYFSIVSIFDFFESESDYDYDIDRLSHKKSLSWRSSIGSILMLVCMAVCLGGNMFLVDLYKVKKKTTLLNSNEVQVTQAVVSKMYTKKKGRYSVVDYVRLRYKVGQKNVSCSLRYSHKNIYKGQKLTIKYTLKYSNICQIITVLH
jgi:hypothetical protein